MCLPSFGILAGEKVAFSDVGPDLIVLEGRAEPVVSCLALPQTLCGQVKSPAPWSGSPIFCTVCTLTYLHSCVQLQGMVGKPGDRDVSEQSASWVGRLVLPDFLRELASRRECFSR